MFLTLHAEANPGAKKYWKQDRQSGSFEDEPWEGHGGYIRSHGHYLPTSLVSFVDVVVAGALPALLAPKETLNFDPDSHPPSMGLPHQLDH